MPTDDPKDLLELLDLSLTLRPLTDEECAAPNEVLLGREEDLANADLSLPGWPLGCNLALSQMVDAMKPPATKK